MSCRSIGGSREIALSSCILRPSVGFRWRATLPARLRCDHRPSWNARNGYVVRTRITRYVRRVAAIRRQRLPDCEKSGLISDVFSQSGGAAVVRGDATDRTGFIRVAQRSVRGVPGKDDGRSAGGLEESARQPRTTMDAECNSKCDFPTPPIDRHSRALAGGFTTAESPQRRV